MTTVRITCPKCASGSVHPTFYTPWTMDCLKCGHEFDIRGGFWRRLWRALTGRAIGGFR